MQQKQIAGITLCKNSTKFDYHAKETILCLLQCTAHVYIAYAESEDNTLEMIYDLMNAYPNQITTIDVSHYWDNTEGKHRLSVCTNVAIEQAQKDGYPWVFYLQSDEIIHPDSYKDLWAVVEMFPTHEGFMTPRLNLWGDSDHALACEQSRQPCSTNIIRLTKSSQRSIDDGESQQAVCEWLVEEIPIFHTGFIRDKHIMIGKVKNMQGVVFGMNPDPALDTMDNGWNPWVSHSKDDVLEHGLELPPLIQEWCMKKDETNKAPTL
jgi:hypothetical protein